MHPLQASTLSLVVWTLLYDTMRMESTADQLQSISHKIIYINFVASKIHNENVLVLMHTLSASIWLADCVCVCRWELKKFHMQTNCECVLDITPPCSSSKTQNWMEYFPSMLHTARCTHSLDRYVQIFQCMFAIHFSFAYQPYFELGANVPICKNNENQHEIELRRYGN